MEIFKHEPIDLERPAFRLLQLLRGNGPAIECMLYQAYLDGTDTVPYEALSYTWGGMEKTATVTVNGKALDVTENLHSALQHLRSKDVDRTLWVDAICINQTDDRERGHQVQRMRDIYSQAEEVAIWLGLATNETDYLMDSLRQLETYSLMHEHRNWDIKQWTTLWKMVSQASNHKLIDSLALLLKRPWFRRVWILQEIAKSKRANVWCGTRSVRARTFTLAPSLIGIKPERHCQAVLDIMPGRLREKSWWSDNKDLYNLLLRFSESEASDPRDNVYALLGISSDARDSPTLRPDYRKSLQEVIQDTSSFLFGPSDTFYDTMSMLLEDLTSRNAASFVHLVKTSGVTEVDHFLTGRGLEVPLSMDIIKAAAENERYGNEIMGLFFHKRESEVMVSERLITAAANNAGSGIDILSLFFQRCKSEIEMTEMVNEAILAASAGDNEKVVKFLLDKGADVNAQFGPYGSALKAAASRGHEAVVRLLLNEGANVNAQDGRYSNALTAASISGHVEVVRLLLNRGAEINAQDREYGSALASASLGGHEAVVRLLLDKGAEVNTQGRHYNNALTAASSRGYEEVVRILLDEGADVNAHGGRYSNAINTASVGGYEAVVRLLLDKGADVNAQGKRYGNALAAASFKGHEAVVRILLDEGADVDAQGGRYGNALEAASTRGHEAVVRLLLDKGADINARGRRHGSALKAASANGHKAVVTLLTSRGAV